MCIDGFSTKEIDKSIKKLENMIENSTYKLPKNYNESVDHPSHYNHGGHETIDIIKDRLEDSDWNAYQGGLLFNVYKYIDRAPYKGKRLEDLKKARWYLDKLIEGVGND